MYACFYLYRSPANAHQDAFYFEPSTSSMHTVDVFAIPAALAGEPRRQGAFLAVSREHMLLDCAPSKNTTAVRALVGTSHCAGVWTLKVLQWWILSVGLFANVSAPLIDVPED
jgi:hypothetical protein